MSQGCTAPDNQSPHSPEATARLQGRSIFLEEYARKLIFEEEMHASEVDKMLRNPGAIKTFSDATPGP
jgi:bacterioferritin